MNRRGLVIFILPKIFCNVNPYDSRITDRYTLASLVKMVLLWLRPQSVVYFRKNAFIHTIFSLKLQPPIHTDKYPFYESKMCLFTFHGNATKPIRLNADHLARKRVNIVQFNSIVLWMQNSIDLVLIVVVQQLTMI